MRRVIILALLFGGVQLVLPLGARGYGGQWLLTFGFLILAADTVGDLTAMAHLPKLVGYLAAGVLFGPSVMNTVTLDATRELAPVSSLAIALIAFLAGAELRWSELRERGPRILKILVCELGLTLVALTTLLMLLGDRVPFLRDANTVAVLTVSLLFASIAIVHSPAVTMALLSETKARGPVARTTLGVVLVSDVAVILLFSSALALARALVPSTGADAAGMSFGRILWDIGGAVIVGAVLGGGVALYLRFVRRELFLFALLVTFFGAEIARLTHVETLLTLLTAGFVMENLSRPADGHALRDAMERSAAPVFVVFFALAGASMELNDVATLWPLVLPIVLVRIGGIWAGSTLGARWGQALPQERKWVWAGLVSQAGVAIGLATVVAQAYPERGAQIRTLFLAVLAVNESLGAILFRHALSRSGELADAETGDVEDEPERAIAAGVA